MWPGNVRELESHIHRALVQSRGKAMVELVHAKAPREHEPARTSEAGLSPPELGFRRAKAAAVQAFERSFIELVMRSERECLRRRALLRQGAPRFWQTHEEARLHQAPVPRSALRHPRKRRSFLNRGIHCAVTIELFSRGAPVSGFAFAVLR